MITKTKLRDFLKRFDNLLLIASLPLIPMLIAEFFIGVGQTTLDYFNVYYVALWLVFTAEFFAKFYLAKAKLAYLRDNWLDALVVLAPIFRSFKVFHLLRTPILLVSDEMVKFFKAQRLTFLYFFVVTIVVIFIAADVVLFFERMNPKANIDTFEDAVWWSFVTFSTLGYGDKYPITFGGRSVAVLLMTLGFALFSIIVAGAVSFFMKKRRSNAGNIRVSGFVGDESSELKMEEIIKRLDSIEKKLEAKEKKKTKRKTARKKSVKADKKKNE